MCSCCKWFIVWYLYRIIFFKFLSGWKIFFMFQEKEYIDI